MDINDLYEKKIFSDLDIHFAQFITHLSDCQSESLQIAALLASYFTAQGHICIDLNAPLLIENGLNLIDNPKAMLAALRQCNVVGQAGEYKPLILDKSRLYLYRYWDYEHALAQQIRQRLAVQLPNIDQAKLQHDLAQLFPKSNNTVDWQKIAAETAVLSPFCIISGGPGTGKTSTVIKILQLLFSQNPHLNIALTAPTGKAAARLQETLTQAQTSHSISDKIPQETYTIHRLLGSLPHSPYFTYHAQNQLPYDVVVVDEASMVDLALMAKLAQAIPNKARWILLGDKDQLASVEAGTVLGDICAAAALDENIVDKTTQQANILQQHIVLLQKNYRFNEESSIGQLATAVRLGRAEQALALLKSSRYADIRWSTLVSADRLLSALAQTVIQGFTPYLQAHQPAEILAAFEQFRILCALRQGPYGVIAMNQLIEHILTTQGKINGNYRWYHGRPIMITRNDYTLKLYNGDVGIVLWNENKELLAYFPSPDGQIRHFLPNRLPTHETVYAMTIHKSQGSEFNHILLLLPEQYSPVLTRELIYTGITRAKQTLHIWANEKVFKTALAQKIQRLSGLKQAILQSSF